jgi:hypothetical protein
LAAFGADAGEEFAGRFDIGVFRSPIGGEVAAKRGGEQALPELFQQRPHLELPELPEGWCWASFEESSWEITGGHVGPMKHRYVRDGITMLRSQNVRPLRFDRSNCEFIPPDFDEEIQKSRLYGNEILVVRSGVNVGDCCVYPVDEGQANCSDLVITRPLHGINPYYAAMFIVTEKQVKNEEKIIAIKQPPRRRAMRRRRSINGLSVRAISGTYVVILGIDMDSGDCPGLMGFAIHRTDHTEDEAYWMRGIKTFAETDPGLPAGANYSTREHPIQGFSWSDYSAKPGHDYTYRVEALFGSPTDLQSANKVAVRIQTESPEGGNHDVYFNRGVAASQAYTKRFGDRRPEQVGPAAYDWLSRGLFEATIGFIESAEDSQYQLRVAAYEFHYHPVLQALKAAKQRGVDVKILFDNRKASPGEKNEEAVRDVGISSLCTRRETHPSYISHNKFIVLVKNGTPESVLTGGTNFSEGGIFGHSNVSHIVEDNAVAAEYLRYWELLQADPENRDLKPELTTTIPLPSGLPPVGTMAVFSPRSSTDALEYYAARAQKANDGLFATFAFGMHASLQDVYRDGQAPLRYAVMEKKTRSMAAGPERDAEEAKIDALRRMKASMPTCTMLSMSRSSNPRRTATRIRS